jgi:ribosome-associated protein
VKKTKRSAGSSGKKAGSAPNKKSAPQTARRATPRKATQIARPSAGGARKLQIPVRGARRTKGGGGGGGIIERRAPALPSLQARANLDEARSLALAAIDAALDKKALAPVLIDVSAMASYTDFIGIVSGRSDRQVDAIAEGIRQVMKANGRVTLGQEGTGNGRWTLLDFGSVVIHVFYHPVREFYDLESLWIEAPRVKLDVPPEATLAQPDALYAL